MNRAITLLLCTTIATAICADPASDLLMRQASGTSMNPQAAAHHMWMTKQYGWTVMLHGSAFATQVFQTGPRGNDKLFSTNWLMAMANRPLAGGHLMFRSMLSLEPLTVTNRSYPMLFQTGETAYGEPLVDAQHPHDFFMELAAEYAHPFSDDTTGFVYAALMGDPSLGPVAFPHRASALEIPQATLGHHTQDSTHIAANVLTVGVQSGIFGGAVSAFHGGEPDEQRWNIESGPIDSWALRVTLDPTSNWSMQVSSGHLTDPEQHHSGDIQRTTASLAYVRPWMDGSIASTFIFGHNKPDGPHQSTSSWLTEAVVQFAAKNYVTARAEMVDRDEIIDDEIFRVKAFTVGYTRDVWSNSLVLAGIGGNLTIYDVPSGLQLLYGRNPLAAHLFLRLRNAPAAMNHSMHH